MSGYDHLTRDELISIARGLSAKPADTAPASGVPDGLPVFGEQARREFEASRSPMRIFDLETLKYLAVNDAMTKLYGYSRQEFLGLTVLDTCHADDHAVFRTALVEQSRYLRHCSPRRHLKKSGEIIAVELVSQDVLFDGRRARLTLVMDITARVRMQELLWQRQQEFESLAENLPDLVARYDSGRRFAYVNAAIEKLFGMGRSEFIGRTQREVGLPDDLVALYDESLGFVFRTARPHKVEFRITTGEEEGLFEALHVPERDAGGNVATVICVARDITERKRAEDELAQQKKLLDTIIENLPVGVFMRDARTGLYIMRNRFAQEHFGYGGRDVAGKSIHEVFPREQAERALETDRRALETGKLLEVPEQEVVGPSGERRIAHVRKAVLPDENGQPWLIVGIADDITERQQAERDLRESRHRMAWVLDVTGIGTWMNPLPLGKLNWDSRTRELFFVPPGVEPTVALFWNRLHPEDREPTQLAMKAALRDRALYAIDHRVVNPVTGEIRWIRSAGKATYTADGTPVLFDGINYDISDRKQQEQELLTHAIQQRDALVREVHHRIKNSLQGVAGVLRQKATKNPAIASEIEETIGQLQSVALVYGLQETRPDGLLSLVTIMDAICSSAEGLIGGRVERAFERKSRRPACVAGQEAVSVAFALNELVFNALKHQSAESGEKRARVTLRESLHEAEIRITNRGRLPKGFDFAEGRAVGGGLGLVRTLLASPGGSIAFNGGPNKVEVVLTLRPPLLAERQNPVTR